MLTPRGSDRDHLRWLENADLSQLQSKAILDLGCGSGFLCQHFAEQGANAVGIDIVKPAGLENSPGKWQYHALDLNAQNWADQLQQKLSSQLFDVIFAFDIIEHVDAPTWFLQNIYNSLRPGGHVVITTPNINSLERLLKPQTWSGTIDPQHRLLFSRYSLRFLLQRLKFRIEQCEAPLRSLQFMKPLQPQIGGQIFCVATKSERV